MTEPLEQLRETLHLAEPSDRWALVVAWFDAHQEAELAQVAETYARGHLHPVERTAPPHWVARALDGSPPLGWALVDGMTLRDVGLPGRLHPLLRRGALRQLRRLELVDCAVGREQWRLLCGPDAPAFLQSLTVANTRRRSDEIRDLTPLLSAPFAATLRELAIRNQRVGAEGARGLAVAGLHLRKLDLSGSPLGADAVVRLAAPRFAGSLDVLNLANTGCGDRGARAIAAAIGGCRTLALSNNGVTGQAWVGDGKLDVVNLAVGGNPLGAEGMDALLKTLGDHTPQRLALWACGLDAAGINLLARGPQFPQLERLELGWNRLGAAGVAALSAGTAEKLSSLSLRSTKCGDDGARALAAVRFPSLRRLSLRRCHLTHEGINALCKAPWARDLEELNLEKNPAIGPGARAALEDLATEGVRVLLSGPNDAR